MRSAFSSWRLYSWMRLTWQSTIVSGSSVCAAARRAASARAAPGPRASPRGTRRGSRRRRRAAPARASSPRSVIQPSPIASRDRCGRARGFASSSQRRGVTPLVLLLKRSGKSSARSLSVVRAQQLGVDRGDAVGAVRAHDGEMRHAHVLLGTLLDQAHALDALLVAREARAHVVEQAPVDLVDDLELPRQQQLEPRDRPLLERLGQQRVVRVGERAPREVPGLVPAELRLVEQDAHQLGHRERRVRVVQLDRDLLGQRAPVVRCRAGSAAPGRRASRRPGSTPGGSAAPARARWNRPGYSTRVSDSAASVSASASTNSPRLKRSKSK